MFKAPETSGDLRAASADNTIEPTGAKVLTPTISSFRSGAILACRTASLDRGSDANSVYASSVIPHWTSSSPTRV